jgi:hypothetical protein
MSNTEQINKFFNGGSSSKLVHLNTEQANTFLDYVYDESVMLKNANFIRMNTPKKDIATIDIASDIFFPATANTAPLDANDINGTPSYITLTTKELIGRVVILDSELEDNIEGAAFEDKVMRMVAKKASNQLDRTGAYARVVS